MKEIKINKNLLSANDQIAAEIREKFRTHNIFSINMMSSPGSGKTTLIERTLQNLKNSLSIGVIVGDVQTEHDAQRIARFKVPVKQIVTRGSCHLNAQMVKDALPHFTMKDLDFMIIENVGNLVCPSNYDLGEDLKVTLISVTEGDDKPLKYPAMFRVSSVFIINKLDLLPYTDFDMEQCKKYALSINPKLTIFTTSCISGEGLDEWFQWIQEGIQRRAT
jgi:hydrogenase nickel incorporation protein HypB